ncbi:MAG: MFS transporter [Rhodospirillaceae bacterium]|jgi:MFS family permease|nr:MFS transporter [Rhodospirillaceae bacterium]MBT5455473.1 MFS transporter [Rhodospirillaceae bacterium]
MFMTIFRTNPRGWIIVAILFFALSFSFSARMALPVLIPGWGSEFEWSQTFMSFGAALIMIVMGSVAPIAGHFQDKFGPRLLVAGGMILSGMCVSLTSFMGTASLPVTASWVFFGLFCTASAIGYGMISLPVVTATISRNFEENRGLATSIGTSGVGGGQLIFIPVIAWAVTEIGWRPTLFGFGIIIAVLGFGSLFLLDNKVPDTKADSSGLSASASVSTRLLHVFRSPIFWLLGGSYFICGFTTAGIVKVHLIPYAKACGFNLTTGAAAIGILAGFDMVGMIISGYLTDRFHRPALLGSVYFLRALTFIMLFFLTDNVILLLAFAVLFGTLDFATVPPTAGLVASHLGINTMGLTMGIMFAGHSLGGAVGAVMAGWIFDSFARYDWTWIVGLALALLAAILAWSVPEKRDKARDDSVPAGAAA